MAKRAECRSVESFLDAYVDGEFDGREAAEVEAHLASCGDCQDLARLQASYKEAVRRAGTSCPAAPAELREKIHATLGDPAAYARFGLEDELAGRPSQGRWWTGPKGIAAAAAVAGAAVWFAAGGLDRPPRQPHSMLGNTRSGGRCPGAGPPGRG